MDGYVTIKEMAQRWGLTERRVQKMCSLGMIPGAGKFGSVWAIPSNAERPKDGRVTTGEYKNWREKYGNKKD